MSVILRNIEEWNAWITLPAEEVKEMQKRFPDDASQIVARATKGDLATAPYYGDRSRRTQGELMPSLIICEIVNRRFEKASSWPR